MGNPQSAAQQLDPGALVELYQLDTSALTNINGVVGTGSVYLFTPGTIGGAEIVFAGASYTPIAIEGTGFEWNGQGQLPQPNLRITNVTGLATGLVIEFGDMLGAIVTRTLVLAQFLDGQPDADPTASFPPESYRINRMSSATKEAVEFELRAIFDAEGLMLPRRQCIRNTCTQTYRAWNPDTSSFVPGSCPWIGSAYFKADGTATGDPSQDVCGKQLTDCIARFGTLSANPALPTYAFPGVGITPQ